MTRRRYDGCVTRAAEVRRILERYLVEVVERHALCPWARSARERGELDDLDEEIGRAHV